MYSNLFTILTLGLSGLTLVAGNHPVLHDNDMKDSLKLAKAAAPEWNFVVGERCFPTPGLDAEGAQHKPGLDQCAKKPKGEAIGLARPFPTYYSVRHCTYEGYDEYHVMYNVYFPFSTNFPFGHAHDWEWAVVKWGRLPSNKNYWIRQNITLEAHGGKTEYRWDEYPFTNTDKDRALVQNSTNPVIVFSNNGHGLVEEPDASPKGVRGDWYRSSDTLISGDNFPVFEWGSANSSPNTFEAGGQNDLCWV